MIASWDDGMVVGNLAVVEDPARLGNLAAMHKRLGKLFIAFKVSHNPANLWIDIIGEILGVNPWIGGKLLLIECLDGAQRLLCTHPELPVTVHL